MAWGRSNCEGSSSIRPASTFDRSRMSLMSASRCRPDSWMSLTYSACLSLMSPNIRSPSTSENPMMAFSGVRSSCDMLARNSLLCLLAISSCRLFVSISRKRRAFWIAKGGLRGECLQEIDHVRRELSNAVPVDDQAAQQVILAQERHRHERPMPRSEEHLPGPALVDRRVGDVADLDRLSGHCHSPERTLSLADRRSAQSVDQLVRQPVRGMQVELLSHFVVLVDRPAIHASELRRASDDRGQHGLQVERRADRLADVAQRSQFIHRLRQIAGAHLQFLEQPNVLDRDHGLVRERLQQGDQLVWERSGVRAGRRRCHRSDCRHAAAGRQGCFESLRRPSGHRLHSRGRRARRRPRRRCASGSRAVPPYRG